MSALIEHSDVSTKRVDTVAKGLAKTRNPQGAGMARGFCVRLPDAVLGLINAAKPADQSIPEYLREAGVSIALQRLEASQK